MTRAGSEAGGGARASRGRLWGLALGVALLAIVPRLEPALRGFHASPDAVEYLLIARSLRAGEGFVLPIRVRSRGVAPGTPARHLAYGERAPLYPWLLSGLVDPAPGWPSAALQLSGVCLAACAAALACLLTARLGELRGLGPAPLALAAGLGGLSVAWQPFLVRASIHLWAEPLGLCLVLGAALAALSPRRGPGGWLTLAVCLTLARHARPEAWVVGPVALLWLGRQEGWRPALALAGAVGAGELALLGLTGNLAPQLGLLAVSDYRELMVPGASSGGPGVLAGWWRNASGQLGAALLPKNAAAILPLALLGWRGAATRLPHALAGALALATIAVWSTHDPSRFTIAPLCLLAGPACLEGVCLAGRLPGRWRRRGLALGIALWLGVLGHAAGRSQRGRSAAPPPLASAVPQPGEPVLDDPWSYALLTGRPAHLRRPPGASPP